MPAVLSTPAPHSLQLPTAHGTWEDGPSHGTAKLLIYGHTHKYVEDSVTTFPLSNRTEVCPLRPETFPDLGSHQHQTQVPSCAARTGCARTAIAHDSVLHLCGSDPPRLPARMVAHRATDETPSHLTGCLLSTFWLSDIQAPGGRFLASSSWISSCPSIGWGFEYGQVGSSYHRESELVKILRLNDHSVFSPKWNICITPKLREYHRSGYKTDGRT